MKTRLLRFWLLLVVFMIIAMVMVGGLTRLTGSGLSMVHWRPLLGAIPPMSADAWQEVYHAYQQFPEFQAYPVDLAGFKRIFVWEYSHRLLGRLVGLVFMLPFFWFLWRGYLSRPLARHFWVALLLGAGQGLMGWYMVKSGLIDEPRVSHYRLAAHLGLALFLGCWLMWSYWSLAPTWRQQKRAGTTPDGQMLNKDSTGNRFAVGLLVLVALQILYGAFTAGLRAGTMHNTFPTMSGYWLPPMWLDLEPLWLNFLRNETTVQWTHRLLGTLLLVLSTLFALRCHRASGLAPRLRQWAWVMAGSVWLQFGIGVVTLLQIVPVAWASIHQIGAVLVLTVSLYNVFLRVGLGRRQPRLAG